LTTRSPAEPPDDLFTAWLTQTTDRTRARGRQPTQPQGTLRFAFYGRMSTTEYQDPTTSQQWQQDNAARLIAGHGTVIVKYFDAGYSRSLPWHQRPAAANLLHQAAQPDRTFDAIVIGEYERAFTGQQAIHTIRYLNSHGITVWLPEANRPIDLDEPAHQALLMMLGHQCEREVLRFRMRTTAAMCAQARDQGRHLGGRPPYGYQLIDAGPHPNRAHAAWGRRLHRLDPDPQTAAHVKWIFAQRLAGASTASIARQLNDRRIPSPAGHDPDRNRHRTNTVWTLRTVAAILANPRYTGRQVWNRQRTDHHETVPGDKRSSLGPTRTWNPKSEWITSTRRTHPALISDTDFLAAQHVTAISTPNDHNARHYALTGLLVCGLCGRRLEGHWVHGRPGYRCRHGRTSAHHPATRPRSIYWPERQIKSEILRELERQGFLAASAGVDGLAAYLRDHDTVIVCNAAQLAIDEHGVNNAATDPANNARRPPQPAPRPRIPAQRGTR
ncbi:MAG: hypothetical protein QOG75_1791, partial [Mycobacterium sp.]|nr:hypothetical protein [Mycobacterium sp.]